MKYRPDSQNGSKKKKGQLLIVKLGIGLVIWYFLFFKSSNEILNYPRIYSFYIFLAVLAATLAIRFKKMKDEILAQKDFLLGKFFSGGINFAYAAIISLFITGIILGPFNYYDIYLAHSNDIETYKCEIDGIKIGSGGRTTPGIYFIFKGKIDLINGYIPIMSDIHDDKAMDKYWLVLKARQGFVGTYIVESWDIEHK